MQPPSMPFAETLAAAMQAAAKRMASEGRPDEDSRDRRHRLILAPFVGDLSTRSAYLNDVLALYESINDWPNGSGWADAFPVRQRLTLPDPAIDGWGPPGLWHRYLLPGDQDWWAFFLLGLRLGSAAPEQDAALEVRRAVHAEPLNLELFPYRAHGLLPLFVIELWFDFRANQTERWKETRAQLRSAFYEFAQAVKDAPTLIGANPYFPGAVSLLARLSLPGKYQAAESWRFELQPRQRSDAWLTAVVEAVDKLWDRVRLTEWFPVRTESAPGEGLDLLGEPSGTNPSVGVIARVVMNHWAPHVFQGHDPPQRGTDHAAVCDWWDHLFGARCGADLCSAHVRT